MIRNATLTNITPRPVADLKGTMLWGAGTVVDVRVAVAPLTRGQSLATDARIAMSDATLYVLMSELPDGTEIIEGYRITVTQDGQPAAAVWQVTRATRAVKLGGLSHWELFLRAV